MGHDTGSQGTWPLSGVVPLYNGVIAGLDYGSLQGSSLNYLALSAGSSVLSVWSVGLPGKWGVCLVRLVGSLVQRVS